MDAECFKIRWPTDTYWQSPVKITADGIIGLASEVFEGVFRIEVLEAFLRNLPIECKKRAIDVLEVEDKATAVCYLMIV
jgi:hypothetical protein